MKRIIAKLFVFLLLGAVVNVALAWGFAAYVHPNGGTSRVEGGHDDRGHSVAISEARNWGRTRISHFPVHPRPGMLIERFEDIGLDFLSAGSRGSTDNFGWPWRALTCRNDAATVMLEGSAFSIALDGDQTARLEGGIDLTPWTTGPGMTPTWRALPLRPIWPGFAINTVFYAIILWLLFAASYALRRSQRIKRGLCAKCAYPVGTSEVCTECGAAVHATAQRM